MSQVGRYVALLLLIAGIAIAGLGIGADVLLGGSPGFSIPQLMLVVAGVALIGFGVIGLLPRWRTYLVRHLRPLLIGGMLVIAVMLLLFEFVLAVIGFKPRYALDVPATFITPVDWWVCDEQGCRYDAALRAAACLPADLSHDRSCHANPQGYPDSQPFTADDLPATGYRILALGDSFTYGASAALGSSFIEHLEVNLPDTVIWNTGIPGAGTNQALAAFQHYAPIMQPDLVLLGFYTNDFEDNVYPLDSYLFGTLENGELLGIRQYRLHDDGSVTKIETQADFYYRYNRLEMPSNTLTRAIGSTRVGTLLLNTSDAIRNIMSQRGARWDVQVNATRTYLAALRDETEALGIPLLVLLIPDRDSLTQPRQEYEAAQALLDELQIPYLNPYDELLVSDYAPAPDDHWNDAGHTKAALLLQSCIQQVQAGSAVAECATGATIP